MRQSLQRQSLAHNEGNKARGLHRNFLNFTFNYLPHCYCIWTKQDCRDQQKSDMVFMFAGRKAVRIQLPSVNEKNGIFRCVQSHWSVTDQAEWLWGWECWIGNLAFITFVYHYTFYSRLSFAIQQVPTSHGLTFLYASIKYFWWLVSPVGIHYRCQCQAWMFVNTPSPVLCGKVPGSCTDDLKWFPL